MDVDQAVTVVERREHLAPRLVQECVQVTIDRPAEAEGALDEGGLRWVTVTESAERWAAATR